MRIVVLFFVFLASVAGTHGASLTDTIARVKPSVVGVGTFDEISRPQTELLGTGFAVADGRHIVTAVHVVDSQSLKRTAYLAVFVGEGENAAIRRAKVVARDQTHDVALLRIEGAPLPPLALDSGPLRPDGTEIAFTGFPIGAVYGLYPASHRGMISASAPLARPQVNPGELTADMIRALDQKLIAYQLDATSFPGNSGGPLYDAESGQVIGIINSTFVQERKENSLERPSGVTFAMPVESAIALIKANGLRP